MKMDIFTIQSTCMEVSVSLSCLLVLVMCNSGDISIYCDMKFHIVI